MPAREGLPGVIGGRIIGIVYCLGMSKRRIPRYRQNTDRLKGTDPQPSGRIPADLSKQAPHNSYDPLLFYDDRPFVCVDCGKEEVWTAKQQQWWYEVAKGPIQSYAIRCRTCRQARRAKRENGSEANIQPITHGGAVMKLVRADVEPAILAAGFAFEARNKPMDWCERVWIDYKRCDQLLSLAFEIGREHPARLVAELLEGNGVCQTGAVAEFDKPRTRAEILATIKSFASAVKEFLASLETAL